MFWSTTGGSDDKEPACNSEDPGSIPGLGRAPGEERTATHLVLLPVESNGQRSPAGYRPWRLKESDMTEQLTASVSQTEPM